MSQPSTLPLIQLRNFWPVTLCVRWRLAHVAGQQCESERKYNCCEKERECIVWERQEVWGRRRDSVDLPNTETQIVSETLALSPG